MTGQHRHEAGGTAPAIDLINRIRGLAPLPSFHGDLPITRPRDREPSAGGTVAADVQLPDPMPAATAVSRVIPLGDFPPQAVSSSVALWPVQRAG